MGPGRPYYRMSWHSRRPGMNRSRKSALIHLDGAQGGDPATHGLDVIAAMPHTAKLGSTTVEAQQRFVTANVGSSRNGQPNLDGLTELHLFRRVQLELGRRRQRRRGARRQQAAEQRDTEQRNDYTYGYMRRVERVSRHREVGLPPPLQGPGL